MDHCLINIAYIYLIAHQPWNPPSGLRYLNHKRKRVRHPSTGRKTFGKWERRGACFARRTTEFSTPCGTQVKESICGVSQGCDSCGLPQIQHGISLDIVYCIHKTPCVLQLCQLNQFTGAPNRRVPDVRQLTMYSKSVMWSGQEAGGVVGLSADDGRHAGDPTDRAPAPGSDQVCRAVTEGSTPAVATARAARLGMEWG